MKIRQFLVLITLGIVISGCGPTEEEIARAIIAATTTAGVPLTATAEFEQALSQKLTAEAPTPTTTPSPTPTATPTATPTLTATPLPMAEVTSANVYVREGPGTVYYSVTTLSQGAQVQVIGRNLDGTWFLIQLEDDEQGWIAADAVKFDGEVEALPIVDAPPTPTRKITISVLNGMKTKINFAVYDQSADTRNAKFQVFGIGPGKTFSVSLTPDTYLFLYSTQDTYCWRVWAVSIDIYWNPTPGTNFCASFP
ncbi:MAG: SH3 domain-containing protein [Anaerolineae bacterium]|nr:SH3 domain-containing protein [Anaerolineae bacterium]